MGHFKLLQCPLCCTVYSAPVQLGCGVLVCAECLCQWVRYSGTTACPCCYDHQLDGHDIKLPPSAMLDLLGDLKLRCKSCNQTTTARRYQSHADARCQTSYDVQSPSRVSVKEILDRPISAPTLPVERRVAEHLVRRLMAESGEGSVRISTRGQVCKHNTRAVCFS